MQPVQQGEGAAAGCYPSLLAACVSEGRQVVALAAVSPYNGHINQALFAAADEVGGASAIRSSCHFVQRQYAEVTCLCMVDGTRTIVVALPAHALATASFAAFAFLGAVATRFPHSSAADSAEAVAELPELLVRFSLSQLESPASGLVNGGSAPLAHGGAAVASPPTATQRAPATNSAGRARTRDTFNAGEPTRAKPTRAVDGSHVAEKIGELAAATAQMRAHSADLVGEIESARNSQQAAWERRDQAPRDRAEIGPRSGRDRAEIGTRSGRDRGSMIARAGVMSVCVRFRRRSPRRRGLQTASRCSRTA